jgi:uncharacterized protein (TIGR03435 family)
MNLLPVVVALGLVQAQPVFEAASIKRGQLTGGSRGGCHGIDSKYTPNEMASAPPLGRCVIRDARLSHLLFYAYHLGSMGMLKPGPDWVDSGNDRFDVEAKAEDPATTTEAQLIEMLRALIIERFQLKFHRETKDMPGFELSLSKNSPKLKGAKGEEVLATFSPTFKPMPNQLNTLTAKAYSMAKFAELLTQFGQPVVDKTGLTGTYDFTVSWDDTNGPALSTALQQQLGLKFEAEKVPVSILVVDSAQKPSPN